MILKFDKEKLNCILSDYSRVTGVSIALVDSEFEFNVRIARNYRTVEPRILSLKESIVL